MNVKEKVLVFAHRGASSIEPENTLKAFKKAIELKADFIELDVHESKDGEIVITHDEDLNRITGQNGFIKDFTLAELKTFDFGEGEKIPTLQEVIELIKGKISLNCEVKVENISRKIVDIFHTYNYLDSVIVSSFLHEELLKFHERESELKIASLEPTQYERNYNWDTKKKMLQFCIDNNFYAINPFYPIVDQQFVDFAHNHNIKVFPWTVDLKPSIRKLIKFGVDGIITNDVNKIQSILNQ
jgi:glycerophosphoryl diester phosphodiesterase